MGDGASDLGPFAPRTRTGWCAAVGYVAVVAVLSLVAMWDPNAVRGPALAAALLLTLPAAVVGVPVLYVVGATAWNLTNADSGGATWPVTVTYVVVITSCAVVNAGVVTRLNRSMRTRASSRSR